jgi:TonB-linked SusC/RagA family outer membrane protein
MRFVTAHLVTIIVLLFMGYSLSGPTVTRAQDTASRTVSGVVTDAQTGDPLPGVNVVVESAGEGEGSLIGTQTNADGRFSLQVPEGRNALAFSFIGYERQVVEIGDRTDLTVAMVPSTLALEDIVVVGYGTQESVNLTGSVDQVTGDELDRRPVQNVTQALEGAMPNVNVNIQSGRPIESPSINVRGVTSIGQGGDALVLIDGVEGDPGMLNPNNIESISVLKDASAAAVYGARGAFGVVLIETKDAARNEVTVQYSGTVGMRQKTVDQDWVTDSYTWAKSFDEQFRGWFDGDRATNVNKTLPWDEEYLNEIERRSNNPDLDDVWLADDGSWRYAADTDWYDMLEKDRMFSTEHNLRVSAGFDRATFDISGRYSVQEGLFNLNPDNFDMINLRAKGDLDVYSWLRLTNNFQFATRSYSDPISIGEGGSVWRNINDEGHPLAPLRNPDGTYTHSAVYHLGSYDQGNNDKLFDRNTIRNTIGAEAQVTEHLSVSGDYTFRRSMNEVTQRRSEIPFRTRPDGNFGYVGAGTNDFRETVDEINYQSANLIAKYENTFWGEHNLRSTLGYNYEQRSLESLSAQQNGIILGSVEDLNLAVGDERDVEGGFEEWVFSGGLGRINYIFDDRYLVELSGRYDGSSKFPADERYAFFPSASVGWRVSEESFFNVPFVTNLKLRASYGSMGNGNIRPYLFQQLFEIQRTYRIIDGAQRSKTSNPPVLPDGLTWETVTTRNFGLDVDLLSDRLAIIGDVYVRETKDMFTRALTPPDIFGAAPPQGNYADLETRGFEVQVRWRDQFDLAGRGLSYSVEAGLADHVTEITRFNNPDRFLDDFYEGMTIGEVWGFTTEGLFQSEEEIANHADQSRFPSNGTGEDRVGDIKLRDIDGNGEVGPGALTVDNPGDLRVIGNTEPRYRFNFGFDVQYRNVYVASLLEGVAKQDWLPSAEQNSFFGQYNRPYNQSPSWHFDEGMAWSEDNPEAFLPRKSGYQALGSGRRMGVPQTRYLMNGARVRLKNLQVGYEIPRRLIGSFGARSASLYFSGDNLWQWGPVLDKVRNIDIQREQSADDVFHGGGAPGHNYPFLTSYTLGVNLTF